MKKIFLTTLLSCAMIATAQEPEIPTSGVDRKHEIKVGAVKLLAGPILEATYEYIQTADFTYGASILVNFDKGTDYYEDFAVTPFARFYFQEKKEYGAKGFFVEGFGKYSTGNYQWDLYDTEQNYSAVSLGLALGKKWINRTGFVFEILVGAGRTLGDNDNKPEATFRGDLNLGYRF